MRAKVHQGLLVSKQFDSKWFGAMSAWLTQGVLIYLANIISTCVCEGVSR